MQHNNSAPREMLYHYVLEVMALSKDRLIEILSWIILILLLILLVPRDKIRDAQVIFLSKQLLTWFFGLLVVEKGLIKYPVRLFPKANRTSFTFEFFAYPTICIFFNLYYPYGQDVGKQLLHYVYYTSGITVFEIILEKYTNLIKYINWKWYWTWLTLLITFTISNFYYRWFFQL
nr:CBO0543 family protein [Desulforamulus aquiferis]